MALGSRFRGNDGGEVFLKTSSSPTQVGAQSRKTQRSINLWIPTCVGKERGGGLF